jgi:putative transposase
MDARVQFVADYLTGNFTMTELCRRYSVSRPTGYQLVKRYEAEGERGLALRSRRPLTHPQETPAAIVRDILQLRERHPHWGPRTLLQRLRRRAPDVAWPAASTVGVLLHRHGLSTPRRRQRPIPVAPRGPAAPEAANAEWSIDFKGQFATADGRLCYPLTVMDRFSRYLLGCRALAAPRSQPTRAVLEALFREFGLPDRIRSDNGVPFAGPTTIARLSRLSVWFIRLGILPELIQPGCPAQNGRHERMHRTLKQYTARPPASTLAAQQRRFAAFRAEYNEERPHAALNGLTPTMLYVPSSRPLPRHLPEVTYPGHYAWRRVKPNGCVKWRNQEIVVTTVLIGELVGLEEIADDAWAVYFGPVRLGTLDERRGRLCPVRPSTANC